MSIDILQKIYFKFQDNWESLTKMKCINKMGENIQSMLILIKIQQLTPWFKKNLSNNITVIISER